jgi:hypothetical protein
MCETDGIMSGDTTNAKPSAPRPKRRWFRHSLRTLLLALTVIGLVLGLKVIPTIEQKHAVSALKGNGRLVAYQYDYQLANYHGDVKGNPPPEPACPAKLVG